MTKRSQPQGGFALLFTIVIVSIVLALGLTILDFTVKQITLSSVTRDSEIAFYMSNAGFECMKQIREADPEDTAYIGSDTPAADCLGDAGSNVYTKVVNSIPFVYGHEFEFTQIIPGSSDRCSKVSLLVADARAGPIPTATIRSAATTFSPDLLLPSGTLDCPQRTVCNYAFSVGSNRACGASGVGVVQREVFGRF